MAHFRYQALDAGGRRVRGWLQAESARQARTRLREQGLMPTGVVPAGYRLTPLRRGGLPAASLVLLTQQLATLLNAGLPLERALTAVIEQTTRSAPRQVLEGLRLDILQGQSFASALAARPGVFSPLYRALIDAGEHSGRLGAVLARLADYLERRARARQKVIQALAYPVAVMLVAILVVTGMMAWVVPQVVGVFAQSHQALPWLTRALMAVSAGLRAWGVWLALSLALILLALRRALARPVVRRVAEAWLLRLPVVGSLVLALNTARMASTLAILVASGVPLLSALATVRPLLGCLMLREALSAVADAVREGQPLARALGERGCFPPVLVHLVGSGEASGTLAMMLERAAEQQQQEVERRLGTFSALMEPLLILFMGGVVLLIVLAIMLPIIDMNQMVR
ncbi:MAG: type II secretion system inner membrane protein GspF [Paludibacterium sp.]|uniref:type II secretion system inner membrane protein GspF n=1 Tax=Paludibacterium sp. TaxID=1917523 RepID=UPI0025D38243|nr:type II secretion system inner membrane protein GspF [Paludibacterium sp.]MBV8048910.1 type II secretion system inner membrane protein GspF [Paludibacterium sp.]MBV8649718.1 type II secretion system inner membrane protein GspF [Paludibacterium sp.]